MELNDLCDSEFFSEQISNLKFSEMNKENKSLRIQYLSENK